MKRQRFEYRMTPAVHLSGSPEAGLNAIAAEGWRLAHMVGGGLIWERPIGETEPTATTTEVAHG